MVTGNDWCVRGGQWMDSWESWRWDSGYLGGGQWVRMELNLTLKRNKGRYDFDDVCVYKKQTVSVSVSHPKSTGSRCVTDLSVAGAMALNKRGSYKTTWVPLNPFLSPTFPPLLVTRTLRF